MAQQGKRMGVAIEEDCVELRVQFTLFYLE